MCISAGARTKVDEGIFPQEQFREKKFERDKMILKTHPRRFSLWRGSSRRRMLLAEGDSPQRRQNKQFRYLLSRDGAF